MPPCGVGQGAFVCEIASKTALTVACVNGLEDERVRLVICSYDRQRGRVFGALDSSPRGLEFEVERHHLTSRK